MIIAICVQNNQYKVSSGTSMISIYFSTPGELLDVTEGLYRYCQSRYRQRCLRPHSQWISHAVPWNPSPSWTHCQEPQHALLVNGDSQHHQTTLRPICHKFNGPTCVLRDATRFFKVFKPFLRTSNLIEMSLYKFYGWNRYIRLNKS